MSTNKEAKIFKAWDEIGIAIKKGQLNVHSYLDITQPLIELLFEKYADEHNQKQPGYPGYFENGIPKDFREFIKWYTEKSHKNKKEV